jgi:oxygen-independent coproporphyrinogen-3 oxidase
MQVEEVVGFLRGAGVGAINFDLICGLPGQTAETAFATAGEVVRLRPSRIALYSYAHVPWMKAHQKALERHWLPSPELKMTMFLTMLDAFKEAGYTEIGMDHLALPDDALARALDGGTLHRNFMGYTTQRGLDLAAFGASAISFMGAAYSQNVKDLDAYMASVNRGELPIERGFLLSREDEIRREFILDLFCNFAVDLARFGERHGLDAESFFAGDYKGLAPLAADGLVTIAGGRVAATETGRFFIRNICMAFDRYLEKEPAGRMYSRTV